MGATSSISQQEIELLTSAISPSQWEAACQEIKQRRGGTYPSDWTQRVLETGLYIEMKAAWNIEKLKPSMQARARQKKPSGFWSMLSAAPTAKQQKEAIDRLLHQLNFLPIHKSCSVSAEQGLEA